MNIQLVILVVILCIISVLAYIRFAPNNPKKWHVNPSSAETTGKPNEFRLANDSALIYDISALELSKLVGEFIESQEHGKILAQSTDKTHTTYIQRSKLIGYPDYISVEITAKGNNQSKIEILSRSRFGYSDLGVNKKRINNLIAAIDAFVMG